jgi:hypothetical protein
VRWTRSEIYNRISSGDAEVSSCRLNPLYRFVEVGTGEAILDHREHLEYHRRLG